MNLRSGRADIVLRSEKMIGQISNVIGVRSCLSLSLGFCFPQELTSLSRVF
jgi:hypothetical protein